MRLCRHKITNNFLKLVHANSGHLRVITSHLSTKLLHHVMFFLLSYSTHCHAHHQVSVIKAKISDELGMPTGKQKLQIGVSYHVIVM